MKAVLKLFLIFTLFASISYAKTDYPDVHGYLEATLHEGYAIFENEKLNLDQRKQKSAEVVRSNMHLDWMAKSSLGRHKKNLTKDKINEFVSVYKQFIIITYSEMAASYEGQKAKITGVRKLDDSMFIASTEIVKPGAAPFKVDYLVHKLGPNNFKTGDIITEGVSILNSQQSEFNSVITSRGIDALITDLKSRIKKSKLIQARYSKMRS